MKRISLYIDKHQHSALKNLPGKTSEHIRKAIADYLDRQHNVSTSNSANLAEEKVGDGDE